MQWPPDHPAVTDPALAPWAGEVDRLCPDAALVRVLRHLPGRRVTTLVSTSEGPAVLKLFATSRARGGHRRLSALAESEAGPFVPRPMGYRKGHLLLVEFVPGMPLSDLDDEALPSATRQAGRALRAVHDSRVSLDRTWTVGREIEQLRRTAGPWTRAMVERAIRRWTRPDGEPMVPSHRDCYPAQVVMTDRGIRLIDLDDAAMAPRALDLGNFLAHLDMDARLGRRRPGWVVRAGDAFVDGYGFEPDGVEAWTGLSLARLAALAETRHGSSAEAQRLSAVVDRAATQAYGRPA